MNNRPRSLALGRLGGCAALGVALSLCAAGCAEREREPAPAAPITLSSLLAEMTDSAAVAQLPEPEYRGLQASSYNRASTNRKQPNQDETGWFADEDSWGFIRTEGREWVILEHEGPGCITKMWTPFFYYDFNDRKGPDIRIYLDDDPQPVLDENFIALVTGQGSFPLPFVGRTARAGNSYLPIPFAKRCKVTLTRKPFYNIVNYRAYPTGTRVESFDRADLGTLQPQIAAAGKTLMEAAEGPAPEVIAQRLVMEPHSARPIALPSGPSAVRWFSVHLDGGPASLRSTILKFTCDGEQTIWCPLGDFFCSADAIHPFHTWQRTVSTDGTMTSRWLMPYRTSATLEIENLGPTRVTAVVRVGVAPWTWTDRSMYFHAHWRPDEWLPGAPMCDWNFIDIRGEGVYIGDAWTVLNPTQGWWGEGDEKIYVDGDWDRGFPSHFGTGTEDYYGWAGGVVPTRADEFSAPFLANVRVGGVDGGQTRGFNICTRTRMLDAIPFSERLCFDMEASPGTDQRRPTDYLGYSAVTFWYARPGATHNRPPQPTAASRPIMALADLAAGGVRVRTEGGRREVVEFELLHPTDLSPGLQGAPQVIGATLPDGEAWDALDTVIELTVKPGRE
jgi:hypothetical protein